MKTTIISCTTTSLAVLSLTGTASAFIIPTPAGLSAASSSATAAFTSKTALKDIVSPFDAEGATDDQVAVADPFIDIDDDETPLDLTWDNVDMVLDTMRPYLIQDGGNVIISEIDGPVVRLQLEGACGTCPSSTQTMKMGLERKLRERIPEIQEVVQAMPEGPPLEEQQIDTVLDGVRPFLQVAGGSISLDRIVGEGGLQPSIWLKMEGASATLQSVRLEIAQRLQRHFMIAGLHVEWVDQDDDEDEFFKK